MKSCVILVFSFTDTCVLSVLLALFYSGHQYAPHEIEMVIYCNA